MTDKNNLIYNNDPLDLAGATSAVGAGILVGAVTGKLSDITFTAAANPENLIIPAIGAAAGGIAGTIAAIHCSGISLREVAVVALIGSAWASFNHAVIKSDDIRELPQPASVTSEDVAVEAQQDTYPYVKLTTSIGQRYAQLVF